MATEIVATEDGHAQEGSFISELVPSVKKWRLFDGSEFQYTTIS